jgi:hypothetical protein
MNHEHTGLRILVWLGVPLGCVLLCALGGAALGSFVGGALGHPEGEGFIGFIYGLYGGGAVGALVGAFAAWRIDVSIRRSAG